MKSLLLALTLLLTGSVYANEIAPLTTVALPDGRGIVADDQGRSVYIFDVDQGSESRCYDSCEQAWPPVLLPEGTTVNEPVGLTTRKDGRQQLTLDGKPLYYFVSDAQPGDIKGDGLGGVWHIIVR